MKTAAAVLLASMAAHPVAAAGQAVAGSGPAPGRTLIVGTKDAPPFAFQRADGSWTGISLDLWRAIATERGYRYEIREADLPELLSGLQDGTFDVVAAALTITAEREVVVDFTHPFYASGLGIAVRADDEAGWLRVAAGLFSTPFLRIVASLFVVLLLVGSLVWLFEHRGNPEEFGGSVARGIGAGIWWSAVTMTTVGYGDKAPRTLGGRLVALVWMFAALLAISSLTAAIASALTVGSLQTRIGGPDDLGAARVGSVDASTSRTYLDGRGLGFEPYQTAAEALEALRDQQVDAVVYDAPILRYEVRQQFSGELIVLPGDFERQYYGLALPAGSPLRESVNRTLLERIAAPAWQRLIETYLGL